MYDVGAGGMNTPLYDIAVKNYIQNEKYKNKNTCHVCGGELKSAFYVVESYWSSDIEADKDRKELKYCSKCGLVYVK